MDLQHLAYSKAGVVSLWGSMAQFVLCTAIAPQLNSCLPNQRLGIEWRGSGGTRTRQAHQGNELDPVVMQGVAGMAGGHPRSPMQLKVIWSP